MRNESVAILDIRSYEVTFMLGSKGVNDTFVFYGSHTEKYEGFSTEGFFDENSCKNAVYTAVNSVSQNYRGEIAEVCVGVPSAFVSVVTKGHTCSFPTKRKITAQDTEILYESGLCTVGNVFVNRTCISLLATSVNISPPTICKAYLPLC